MPRPLSSLLSRPTKEEVRAKLLRELQGVGFCHRTGYSPGTVDLLGVPKGSYSVVVAIETDGELGGATFKLSIDGGASWGTRRAIPSTGLQPIIDDGLLLPKWVDTGLTLSFASAAPGVGASFLAGDTYAFQTRIPRLPVTSWQSGSTPLTLVENDAAVVAELYSLVADIAAGGFVSTAEGAWMDLAASWYSLTRLPAVTAAGTVTFTCASTAGPYNVADGQLWVQSTSGARFQTVGAFVIPKGGSISVTVRAERPGVAGNASTGTVTALITSLPGVSVANPGIDSSNNWLTTQGADTESDASLASRCLARWPSLAGGGQTGASVPSTVWELWARTADASITRVRVRASRTVAGRTEVFLAGASGPAGAAAVAAADAYIQPRVGLPSTAVVQAAIAAPYTVAAVVYVRAAALAQAQKDCPTNLDRLNASVDIEGTVYFTQIVDALQKVGGVRNVALASTADIVHGPMQVGVLTQQLSFVTV